MSASPCDAMWICCNSNLLLFLGVCSLVMSAIAKMEGDRKCYQLIGGVLIEKTITGVVPDVAFNRDKVRVRLWARRHVRASHGDCLVLYV